MPGRYRLSRAEFVCSSVEVCIGVARLKEQSWRLRSAADLEAEPGHGASLGARRQTYLPGIVKFRDTSMPTKNVEGGRVSKYRCEGEIS